MRHLERHRYRGGRDGACETCGRYVWLRDRAEQQPFTARGERWRRRQHRLADWFDRGHRATG
jgi:hypothetical protein